MSLHPPCTSRNDSTFLYTHRVRMATIVYCCTHTFTSDNNNNNNTFPIHQINQLKLLGNSFQSFLKKDDGTQRNQENWFFLKNYAKTKELRCIYVYYIIVVFVVVCILFCVVQKKKRRSRDESRHRLITERARQTKSVSCLCFPLISDKR